MALFDPKLQLIINGVVIAGWTTANPNVAVSYASGATVAKIDSLNIRGGRQDVTVQPTAMQCSIDVITSTSIADADSKLGANMVVNVYNPVLVSGSPIGWVPLFTGLISDKQVSTDSWSNGDGLYRYTISGYSRFASFQIVSATYAAGSTIVSSADSASARILEVFNQWQYVGSFFGAVNTDTVLLHKRTAGTYLSADLIESAATSAKGCVHDRADGKAYYNSYAQTLQATNGTIETSHIIGNGLSAIRSITDVFTVCVVTSTNASNSDQQDSSTGGQIGLYGKRFAYRTTELQVEAEQATQATAFLTARQNPRWNPDAITIDLGLIDPDKVNNTFTTSAASGNSTTATLTTTTATNLKVGDLITVQGVTPTVYNTTGALVTAVSNTAPFTVSYLKTGATGAQTVAGTVTTIDGAWLAKYFNVRTNSRFTVPLPSALGGSIDSLLDNWNWTFTRGRMFLQMQLSNALYTHDSSEL